MTEVSNEYSSATRSQAYNLDMTRNCTFLESCTSCDDNKIFIGIIISLIASSLLNVGQNLMRLSFLKMKTRAIEAQEAAKGNGGDALEAEASVKAWKSPIWLLGVCIFIVGNFGDLGALTFTPASIITPLGAISLVVNTLMAPLMNKEKLQTSDIVGTLSVITGAVVVVVFGRSVEPEPTVDDLLRLFALPRFIAFLVVTAVLFFGMWYICHRFPRHFVHPHQWGSSIELGVSSDASRHHSRRASNADEVTDGGLSPVGPQAVELQVMDGTDAGERNVSKGAAVSSVELSQNLGTLQRDISIHVLVRFCCSSLGGLIGSTTVLAAKATMTLIVVSIKAGVENAIKPTNDTKAEVEEYRNEMTRWETYMFMLWLAVTAVLQMYWMNRALKDFDALYVIPVYYVMWTVFSVVGGGVFFGEFDCFEVWQLILQGIGIACVFTGVFFLSQRGAAAQVVQKKSGTTSHSGSSSAPGTPHSGAREAPEANVDSLDLDEQDARPSTRRRSMMTAFRPHFTRKSARRTKTVETEANQGVQARGMA